MTAESSITDVSTVSKPSAIYLEMKHENEMSDNADNVRQSATPRTDALEESICDAWAYRFTMYPKMTDFARQLERELNEARKAAEMLHKELAAVQPWMGNVKLPWE